MIPRRIPLGETHPSGVPYYLWCIMQVLAKASVFKVVVSSALIEVV